MVSNVSVIIPAHNESERIIATLRSIVTQTLKSDLVVVVDDNSTDDTGVIADKYLGGLFKPYDTNYTVVRTVGGSKAKAQNEGLKFVQTKYVVAVDADTILDKRALEKIVEAVEREHAVAASSWVMTQKQKTWVQKGRTIEYLFSFEWFKRIQNYYKRPLIASGCFNIYKTSILRKIGGYPEDTLAEDMNATWDIYKKHLGTILFVPEAIAYTDDPETLKQLKNQLARWSCAYFQNYRKHHNDLMHRDEFTGFLLLTQLVNSVMGSLFYLGVVGIALVDPLFALLLLSMDLLLIGTVATRAAKKFKMEKIAWTWLVGWFAVTVVNSYYFLKYLILTGILDQSIPIYVKGH